MNKLVILRFFISLSLVPLLGTSAFATGSKSKPPAKDVAICDPKKPLVLAQAENTGDIEDVVKMFTCTTSPVEKDQKRTQKEYQDTFPGQRSRQQIWPGVNVAATAEEVTFSKSLLGELPPAGWVKAASECADVLCALAKGYGSETAAQKALLIAKKYRYALTLSQEKAAPLETDPLKREQRIWNDARITRAKRVFDLVGTTVAPRSVTPIYLVSGRSLTAIDKDHSTTISGITIPSSNPATKAYGVDWIALKDNDDMVDARDEDAASLWFDKTLVHELVHATDFERSTFDGKKIRLYAETSGYVNQSWTSTADGYVRKPDAKFVTQYSSKDFQEDLADTAAFGLLNPMQAYSTDPGKTREALKIFGGTTYKSLSDVRWKALDQLLDNPQTCTAAVQQCLFQVKSVARSFLNDHEPVFHFDDDVETISRMATVSTCFDAYTAKLLKHLENDSEYCSNNDPRAISQHLRIRCAETYFGALTKVGKLIESPDNDPNKSLLGSQCWSKNDFSEACFGRVLSGTKTQWDSASDPVFNSEDLRDHLFKVTRSRELGKQLLTAVPPKALVVSCLSKLHYITKEFDKQGKPVYFYFGADNGNTGAGNIRECQQGLEEALSKRGKKVGVSEQEGSGIARTEEFKESLQSFVTEIYSKVSTIIQNCKGDQACIDRSTLIHAKRWLGEDSGLSDSEIQAFITKVSSLSDPKRVLSVGSPADIVASCLDGIKSIQRLTGKDGKVGWYFFQNREDQTGYEGTLNSPNCEKKAKDLLVTRKLIAPNDDQKVKTVLRNKLSGKAQDEFKSDVLENAPKIILECGASEDCAVEKIKPLLSQWARKNGSQLQNLPEGMTKRLIAAIDLPLEEVVSKVPLRKVANTCLAKVTIVKMAQGKNYFFLDSEQMGYENPAVFASCSSVMKEEVSKAPVPPSFLNNSVAMQRLIQSPQMKDAFDQYVKDVVEPYVKKACPDPKKCDVKALKDDNSPLRILVQ